MELERREIEMESTVMKTSLYLGIRDSQKQV